MDDVKVKKNKNYNKNSEIILASCIRVPRRRKEFVHQQTYTNKQTHAHTYLILSRIFFTMSLENLSLSSLITTIDDEKKERNASRALMMKRKLG